MPATDIVTESFRLVRAQERVGALLFSLEQQDQMIDGIISLAPELAPELNEMRGRMSETCDHIRAALNVIEAKVELL